MKNRFLVLLWVFMGVVLGFFVGLKFKVINVKDASGGSSVQNQIVNRILDEVQSGSTFLGSELNEIPISRAVGGEIRFDGDGIEYGYVVFRDSRQLVIVYYAYDERSGESSGKVTGVNIIESIGGTRSRWLVFDANHLQSFVSATPTIAE